MRLQLVVLSLSTSLVWCIPPPHPAVVAVRREEERLPYHLRSQALRNPHLQEILPLTSLLHKGEQPVYHREADDVPRQEIYNILTHAGFLPRKPGYYQPPRHHRFKPDHWAANPTPESLFESSLFLLNPELLQHI